VLARLATGYPERAAVPPASFWRLPEDSDTAFWSRGHDPKDLEHPRDLLVQALGGMLSKEGLAAAERTAFAAAFDRVLSDAPFVFARGSDVVAMQKTLVAFQGAKEGPAKDAAARAALEPYLGFWIFGFDEPPARLEGVFRALIAAASRPGTSQWLKKHVEGVPPPTLHMAPVPTGLPKGATHIELAFYLRPDDEPVQAQTAAHVKSSPAKPIRLHALIFPDVTAEARTWRTWMVIASSEELALARAKGLLASTVRTLATRRGLDLLRDGQVGGGGFSSLRAWVALSPEPTSDTSTKAGDPLALLASLPSQGESPILFVGAASPAPPGTPRYTAEVSVPRAAIEDIVSFLAKDSAGRMGGKL